LLNFNILPQPPLNPFLAPSVSPDKLVYTDPALAPGGAGGAPVGPEQPPAVSAYGVGDVPPPAGFQPAPAASGSPSSALQDLLLPAEAPPPTNGPPGAQPVEGTPPS